MLKHQLKYSVLLSSALFINKITPLMHLHRLLSYSTVVACECLLMQDLVSGLLSEAVSYKVGVLQILKVTR